MRGKCPAMAIGTVLRGNWLGVDGHHDRVRHALRHRMCDPHRDRAGVVRFGGVNCALNAVCQEQAAKQEHHREHMPHTTAEPRSERATIPGPAH